MDNDRLIAEWLKVPCWHVIFSYYEPQENRSYHLVPKCKKCGQTRVANPNYTSWDECGRLIEALAKKGYDIDVGYENGYYYAEVTTEKIHVSAHKKPFLPTALVDAALQLIESEQAK